MKTISVQPTRSEGGIAALPRLLQMTSVLYAPLCYCFLWVQAARRLSPPHTLRLWEYSLSAYVLLFAALCVLYALQEAFWPEMAGLVLEWTERAGIPGFEVWGILGGA